MPNHSEHKKVGICDLTECYLPSNFDQKEARRDCPLDSLHLHRAGYRQIKFANIGVIFEFVSYSFFYTAARLIGRCHRSIALTRLASSTAPRLLFGRRRKDAWTCFLSSRRWIPLPRSC